MEVSGLQMAGFTLGGNELQSLGNFIIDLDAAVNVVTFDDAGTLRAKSCTDKINSVLFRSAGLANPSVNPVYDPSYFNGFPAFKFLASQSQRLDSFRVPQFEAQPALTIIMVSTNGNFGMSNAIATRRAMLIGTGPGGDINGLLMNGSTSYGIASGMADSGTDVSIKAFVFDGSQATNATRLKMYKNGVLQSPLTFTGTIPSTTSTNIGNFLTTGRNLTTNFIDGNLLRAIAYTSVLDTTEIAVAFTFLNGIYNVY